MNGTLQDRLVKALRRAAISDLDAANRFLEETFLPELNARFGVPAVLPDDAHRPLSAGTDLARILSAQDLRIFIFHTVPPDPTGYAHWRRIGDISNG